MADKAFLPTLAQLRMFVTLVENRHFGTAAEKLSITQPSLSQGLSTLEKGLDLQLIERSTRKVIVTPVGQKLVPYARAVLEAADVLEAQIYGGRESLTGQLSIGVIPTIAPYLLPGFLSIIQERFPKLEPTIIEATTPHLMENLCDGKIDVALIAFLLKNKVSPKLSSTRSLSSLRYLRGTNGKAARTSPWTCSMTCASYCLTTATACTNTSWTSAGSPK